MLMATMGTVQGRLRVKVKDAKGLSYLLMVPGIYVTSTKSATYTNYLAKYVISDTPGRHTLKFLHKKSDLTLSSTVVDIVAGAAPKELNVTIDLQQSANEVKEFLAKYITLVNDDPPFIGYIEGYVRRKNYPSIVIPNAVITTNGGVLVCSCSTGYYCFADDAGAYSMTVTHPSYRTWNGSVTVDDLITKTKNIGMTPA
jgi:hypothetical protein